jgi:hypothetical protein
MDPVSAVLALAAALIFGTALLRGVSRPVAEPSEPVIAETAPAPVLVDLTALSVQLKTVMTGIESDFRQRQLWHEAEGARQMHVAIRQYLDGALERAEH